MKFRCKPILKALALASVLGGLGAAQAVDLRVGLRVEPTSLDPQFHAVTNNIQLSQSLFDSLVRSDKNLNPIPALAESWTVDGNVWTFKLRPNVKFSDGSPFTAEDVIFSYERARKVPNSPSSFGLYISEVDQIKALDPLTLQLTTKGPAPTLLNSLPEVVVMSHIAAAGDAPEGKTTTQLNSGDGLAGTGPYKFVSWKRGSEIIYERNPNYWGPKPAWDRVIYRPITSAAARVAALLSGDVDIIEDPPTDDLARLRKDPNLHIQATPSVRVVYIALNQSKEVPKGMSGTGEKNPFADRRVREALSLAIDREAIVKRILGDVGKAAANLLPYPSAFGTSEKLAKVPAPDPKRAKELLAEAGYPDGFTISLGSPDGRYKGDKDIAQAVAGMWARIGIKTNVETMTPAVFFQKRGEYAFSAFLGGWAASSGEMINPLKSLVMTRNKDKGEGTTNWIHYSNPEMDRLVAEASVTLDNDKRSKLLQQAGEMAMADYALLPIEFEESVWAMKKSVTFDGRVDQKTYAQDIQPAK